MTILLTEIYDVTLKKGNRGAAKNGFIRPTIGESFMTHRDFVEVDSQPSIGDSIEGGYYFGTIDLGLKVYGLICSHTSLGEAKKAWGGDDLRVTGASSTIDGYQNTLDIITDQVNNSIEHPAADFCVNLNIGGYTDWYLPSRQELSLLHTNRSILIEAGSGNFQVNEYWSSTQYTTDTRRAILQHFSLGWQTDYHKRFVYNIRAIRRFDWRFGNA